MCSKPRSQPSPGDYVGQKFMINIKLVGLEEVEGLSAVELMWRGQAFWYTKLSSFKQTFWHSFKFIRTAVVQVRM